MSQINNIQIGDQLFQIGGTGGNNSEKVAQTIERGEQLVTIPYLGASALAGVVRPNTVYGICPQGESAVILAGLPHEITQESGELWSMEGILHIIVSHDNTEIPNHPHKATFYMMDSLDSDNYDLNGPIGISGFNFLQYLQTNSNAAKVCFYSTSRFLEISGADSVIVRQCLLDGTVLFETQVPQEELGGINEIAPFLISGDSFLIGLSTNGSPITLPCNVEESDNDLFTYSVSLGAIAESGQLYFNSMDPGTELYDNNQNQVGVLIYLGPSYMDVNPVSRYMFNINMSQDMTYITNIPISWDNDTPPVFGEDKLVQISIQDGVGSYVSTSVNSLPQLGV